MLTAGRPLSLAARARRPVFVAPFPRAQARRVAQNDSPTLSPAGALSRGAGAVVRWSGQAAGASLSAPRDAVGSVRYAGGRPARSVGSAGSGVLPVPSPFGPPGRGVVPGSSGVSSAAGGSGVVAAILVAGLLLVGFQQLRRFRLPPVMSGPVGVVSLQQRPG